LLYIFYNYQCIKINYKQMQEESFTDPFGLTPVEYTGEGN